MVLTGWIFLFRLSEAYSVEIIQAEAWWILKGLQVASFTFLAVVGFQQASHLLGEFVQCRVLGLTLRDADAGDLGWLSGIFIFNKYLWGFPYRWFPECHSSCLFPFFISPPSLCQCCGASQKERCFWRWRSRLISHDYLLGVGRTHRFTKGHTGFQIVLLPFKHFVFFKFQRNTIPLLKIILFMNYKA